MSAKRTLLLAVLLTLSPLLPSRPEAAILSPEDTCLLRWASRARTPATKCLQCHDGSAARPIDHLPGLSSKGSHAVGVSYDAGSMRIPLLKPRGTLPKEIVLVDGQLSCTSCHDGRSSAPHRVALPVGELCTACHGQ